MFLSVCYVIHTHCVRMRTSVRQKAVCAVRAWNGLVKLRDSNWLHSNIAMLLVYLGVSTTMNARRGA